MDDNYNVLSVNYCSKCLSPITDEYRAICPECGEPLELIGLDERMKRDGDMGKGSRALYLISELVFAAAYTVNLVYCIIGIVKCASGEKIEPVKSVIGERTSSFQPIWYYGMVYSIILCVLTLFVLIFGISKTVRKDSKGMGVFIAAMESLGVAMLFTRNFLGFALTFVALILYGIPETRIRSDKFRKRRIKRVYKKYDTIGSKVWRCKSCGYINEKQSLECKSCGKYR